jgi:DNA-binding SARP family transcriptional activator
MWAVQSNRQCWLCSRCPLVVVSRPIAWSISCGTRTRRQARRTVQSYIASLRRALGESAALEPSQNGYTLNVDRGQVDLLAFEDQAADLLADVGLDPDDKAQRLADMLSTWETPLDGLRGASRLAELAAPFEELRFQAVEGLAAAQIAGTRAGDAVKMLEALVREYPTRDNL